MTRTYADLSLAEVLKAEATLQGTSTDVADTQIDELGPEEYLQARHDAWRRLSDSQRESQAAKESDDAWRRSTDAWSRLSDSEKQSQAATTIQSGERARLARRTRRTRQFMKDRREQKRASKTYANKGDVSEDQEWLQYDEDQDWAEWSNAPFYYSDNAADTTYNTKAAVRKIHLDNAHTKAKAVSGVLAGQIARDAAAKALAEKRALEMGFIREE